MYNQALQHDVALAHFVAADPDAFSPSSIRRAVWLCMLAGSSKSKHRRVAYKQNGAAAAGPGPVARQSSSCAAGLCLRDSRIIELLSSFHCPKGEAQPKRCVWVLSCGDTSNTKLPVQLARLAALSEFVLLAFVVHFICERDAAQHRTGQ